jgi:hypothetical protein
MGPKALTFIHSVARKSLTKGQGSGITKIPSAMQAEAKASEIFTNLVEAGLKPEMMDDFIRSEADVAKYLNILDAYKRERMKPIPADSPRGREITEALFGKRGEVVDMKGNVIPEGSGIMGGESIESLMKSGDVTKGTVTKKSKKVTDRDMFKAANERLGKPKTDVNTIIKNINSMDPIEAMKEANKVIKREGPYKNLNQQQAKKILEDTEDHIFERNVTDEDFAAGGRVGLRYGGDTMGGINDKSVSSPGPDRSKVSAQQERNHQAAVREAQAFNQKKEETINRIKEAQPKQSPIKTFFNPRLQKHFDQNQMLKDAVARGEITPEQYNELGGYDVQQTLSLGNPLLGGIGNLIGSTGYNIVQSLKDGQSFGDAAGDVYRNVKGGLGLISPELKQTYKNILAQGAGQYQTGGRVGLRYGGDTMGGINDKSISSPGPDRSKVSEQQERSNQEAISRARNSQQYDYTAPKQIAKDIAVNTGKNLIGKKIASALGIGTGPIGILIALKGLYDQTKNPVYSEEDVTYGFPYQTGGRVGLAGGMTRRAFLKLMGGVAAGIGAIKSGIMGVGKKGVAKKVVKEVIKTPPVAGKPEWFDALINKVILEGDDVTKKLATKDREIVHTKKLNDQESVTVTQDLDDGAIRVEYDSPDNLGQEPVMMQFKPGMADETTGGKKPADRFDVVETEPRYVGPDNTDIEFIGESGGPNISFIESDVTNLKTFATGKGPTMKEIVKSKKRKDLTRAVNENDYEAAEYLGGKYGDAPEPDFPDDYSGYASGGLAYMLGE